MENDTLITESMNLMESLGLELSDNLKKSIEEAAMPVYKIAVVGRYQTGKTTLINKVFLKNDFLATGCGLCKTSIVTRLSYGPTPKVAIIKKQNTENAIEEVIENPTHEKIESLTCAEDDNARLELSKVYSEINVEWPCESLKNYIIYDTPGIDDPIEELLDYTTYRTVPQMDLIVMVVDAKQLTEQEILFLKHRLFKNGIKRAIVLVSYNPLRAMSKKTRENILSTIKGQLASIGREYFPVHLCTYSDEVKDEPLNTPESIESCIVNFLKDNAEQARLEKLKYACAYELMIARNQIAAKLAINGKSDEEIVKIKTDVEAFGEQLEIKYKNIASEFKADYAVFKNEIKDYAIATLSRTQDSITELVDSYETYDNLRTALPGITVRAKADFENAMLDINQFAQGKLMEILTKKQSDIESICQNLTLPTSMDVSLNTGWAGKLNPKLVILSEYGIMTYLLGPLGAGIRLATAFIPGLKSLLPNNFVRRAVASSVKNSLKENMEEVTLLISDSLDESGEAVARALAEKFVELHKISCAPYDAAIEAVKSKKLSESELLQMNNFIHDADLLIKKLK